MTFDDLKTTSATCENALKAFYTKLPYQPSIALASLIRVTAEQMHTVFGDDAARVFLREIMKIELEKR